MQAPKAYFIVFAIIILILAIAAALLLQRNSHKIQAKTNVTKKLERLINETNKSSVLSEEQQLNQNISKVIETEANQSNVTGTQELDQLINESNTTTETDISSSDVEQLFI
jgi:biopolymer transport protein ExbB/TolQ